MPHLVELKDLCRTYHMGAVDVHSVRNVSFTLDKGEFIAVMGASGSGKSTLMNLLGCMDRPTSGHYLLEGHDVACVSKEERSRLRNEKLGFVFQSFNLLARATALENVELPLLCSRKRVSDTEARSRANECLELVGLKERACHFPSQLSGGQQQRVAIARAIANKPQILLADEPTGNLDHHSSLAILSLFQQLNANGTTIVLVTHDSAIANACKRTLVMCDGELVPDEPMCELLTHGEDSLHDHPAGTGARLASLATA